MALARALHRCRPDLTVRLLLPERLRGWAAQLGLRTSSPPTSATRTTAGLARWLEAELARQSPIGMVVDVFPRGVLGEFQLCPSLPPRVLLARYLEPRFYQATGEALAGYRRVLWVETPPEALRVPGRHEQIDPLILVDDCLTREAARQDLGLPGQGRCVLALGTGTAYEQRRLLDRLKEVERLRFFSTRLPPGQRVVSRFPAGRLLRAADLVVAAAGYQSYYEIVACGIPAVFVPQRRPLDHQARRALGHLGYPPRTAFRVASSPDELTAAMAELAEARPAKFSSFSGASQAAVRVLQALEVSPC